MRRCVCCGGDVSPRADREGLATKRPRNWCLSCSLQFQESVGLGWYLKFVLFLVVAFFVFMGITLPNDNVIGGLVFAGLAVGGSLWFARRRRAEFIRARNPLPVAVATIVEPEVRDEPREREKEPE
jgi:hypothetical protein